MHKILYRLVSLLLISSLLVGCCSLLLGDEDYETEPTEQEEIGIAPEDLPAAVVETTASPSEDESEQPVTGEREWLVMLYMDADDEILEEDIFTDLNEAERVGSTDKLQIVAQIDRYDGGFDGDGDWTDTRRYAITQDPDLKTINSTLIEELGEVNMASGDTLVDFVIWATSSYPAKKYTLILSDHGMGWPGGFFDPDPGGNGEDDIALAEDYGDGIWLMELDQALGRIQKETGIERFDLIGFDACLMGLVEVYQTMAPYARYAVASQEVEPSLGWAYASFLIDLAFTSEMNGDDLAKSIVNTYIDKDERITDQQARQELADEMLNSKTPSASEAAEELRYDVTLAAVDLDRIGEVVSTLDEFTYAIAEEDQNIIAEAGRYAQSFENAFDEDLPSPYIDLLSFVSLILEYDISQQTEQAGADLQNAIEQAVLIEKHGEGRDGATGLSIYFPVYDLYELSDNLGYTTVASTFTEQSQWDEYLEYYFTNEPPQSDSWEEVDAWQYEEKSRSPGRRVGNQPIEIETLVLSGDVASPEQPVTLDTVVRGSQIAFIYVFIGRVLDDEQTMLIEDIDYIDAEQVKQVGGIFYPEWGSNEVEISYDFEPIVYAIWDGKTLAPALLMPDDYGEESASYVVEGIYHFANGSPDRYAQMIFRDGELERVIGFTGKEGGAPRQITPAMNDQFTILEQGIYLTDDETDFSQPGVTLVFGEDNFTWEEISALPGIYVVGIMAEDFDGNLYAQFEVIEVIE